MGTLLQITEIALQTKETHVLRFIESIWWNFVPNSLYGIGEVITWPKWPTNVGLFFINPPTLPMLSLSGLNQLTRNVYLSICVFVYLYLRFWHMGISFLTSLNNPLFRNIPHGGFFWHFVICCICVFVCLCICVLVFLYLRFWHMGISFWTSLNNPLFRNIPHGGFFWHFVICCICVFVCLCVCVFVYLYFCICAFDTWEYHFWHPWTILFSKIYHMVGLSGTL